MNEAAAQRPRVLFAGRVRLARIFWRMLPWLAFAVVLVFGTWILGASGVAVVQMLVVGGIAVVYGLVRALITELFSPDRPGLRILPVSDGRARRMAATFRALFFFFLLTSLGAALVEANGWREGVADVLRVVNSVVLVLTGAAILSSTGLFRKMRAVQGDSLPAVLSRAGARVFFPLLVLTLLAYVVVDGLGYAPLARWIAVNAGWTLLKVLAGLLVLRWLRRSIARLLSFYRDDRAEADAESPPPVDTVALGIERIAGAILRLVVVVFVFFWVLAGWNLPPATIFSQFGTPLFGGEGVTWGQVLGSVLSVAAVLYAGWLIRSILTYFVFPRSKVGVGARYAILAILHYAVIALAVVFAIGGLGVDMSSFGWFFGAAGVGIGFGLQDVIGNFISGLIMLVERPIRVGDWVKIGEATGTVENVHMRGTTLRTFDNTTVLIPNRQLLGERVTNLTHGMERARIRIPVGVAYGSDVEKVMRVLLGVADDHEEILDDPAPNVLFDAFGESSLDFFLVCHTDQVRGRLGISSQLRLEILKRLGEAGIEIPLPQRDFHLRSGLLPGQDQAGKDRASKD